MSGVLQDQNLEQTDEYFGFRSDNRGWSPCRPTVTPPHDRLSRAATQPTVIGTDNYQEKYTMC